MKDNNLYTKISRLPIVSLSFLLISTSPRAPVGAI